MSSAHALLSDQVAGSSRHTNVQDLRASRTAFRLGAGKRYNQEQDMRNPPPKRTRRGMEAFGFRDFRRYQLARVTAILGAEAQSVAVAWQVYSITHRALDLGYTGLALFLPGLLFLLPAGHVADRFDRRQIILVCYGLQVLCTTMLLLLTRAGLHHVSPIYAVLFCMGTARAFSGPASWR